MKKYIESFIVCMTILFGLTSCIDLQAYDDTYRPYYNDNNVVVVGNTCYVYYDQPTTLFLNSLYVIDGSYYYRYSDRYVRVVFPNWREWSPNRYFYYERDRWLWKWRSNYNYNGYNNHSPRFYRGTPNNLEIPRSMRVFTNQNREGLIIIEGRR